MTKRLTDYRWVLMYGPENSVTIEPAENGCRDYDCCLGESCGFTVAEVQASMVDHYQRQADFFRNMTPEAFLQHQGYFEDGADTIG